MNNIKFRAKPNGTQQWKYGFYAEIEGDGYIINDETCFDYGEVYGLVSVDIKTVGQYTGFIDKNDKGVYVNDICKIWIGGDLQIRPYVVNDVSLLYFDMNGSDSYCRITDIEVIGNTYDNPELLEEEK